MKFQPCFALIVSSALLLTCGPKPEPNPNGFIFPEEYIAEHQGRYIIEIPEIFELANSIMAVAYQNNSGIYFIQKQGPYFQEVVDYFNAYHSSPLFTNFTYRESDFNENYSFRTNSYRYIFIEEDKIAPGMYPVLWKPNLFEEHIAGIEAFVEESEFRNFYQQHTDYYTDQIALYDSLIPVQHIWNWIEQEFTAQYDCYKIVISPLTAGSYNTTRLTSGEYKESIMFVPGILRGVDSFDSLNIATHISNIFTEIDHNYINPVSDQFRDEITSAMGALDTWKSSNHINEMYDNANTVFNEYLTWAVYEVYLAAHYSPQLFGQIQAATISKMKSQRGFTKYQEFEACVLDLYKNKSPEETLEDLYPQIIDWVRTNN